MFRNPETRIVLRYALIICGVVFLSTLTRNWAVLGLVFYGISAAASYKPGKTICAFLLLSFMQMLNPVLMPRYHLFTVIARFGSFAMLAALILSANGRSRRHQIPLGLLVLYLAFAVISSTYGYFPLISYLKIVNFAFFILGLYLGTRNLHQYPNAIAEIRHCILAIILLLTYGTLLTLPFPSVAYFTSLRSVLLEYGFAYATRVYSEGERTLLLTGITIHSQFLGPTAASCFGWLLCDMWLVKRRLSLLHLALLIPIPFICFMTRSRLALFILLPALLLTTLFCLPKAKVPRRVKASFWGLITLGFLVLFSVAVISEVQDRTISRWLRKTDDVSSDDRSLGTALTISRQGLIDMNLRDFRRNRFLGSGFQVASSTRAMYKAGKASIFSATIEKGLLPLMVLGETGILGAVVFSIFLIVFYTTCRRKHYVATATLFTIYLFNNMAEATFFSPSGAGGFYWLALVVGSYCIDMQQYIPSSVDHLAPRFVPNTSEEIEGEGPFLPEITPDEKYMPSSSNEKE